jgi:hypothetical protein
MVDGFNIAASISSIILAFVAIAQATYYFTQTKSTEERVSVALAEIKSAAQSLERLSGRYLDRLTKHVAETSNRQSDMIYELAVNVREIPRTMTEQLARPPETSPSPEVVQSSHCTFLHTTTARLLTFQGNWRFLPSTKSTGLTKSMPPFASSLTAVKSTFGFSKIL